MTRLCNAMTVVLFSTAFLPRRVFDHTLRIAGANQSLRTPWVHRDNHSSRPIGDLLEHANRVGHYCAGRRSAPPKTHTAPKVSTDPLEQSENVGGGTCTRM